MADLTGGFMVERTNNFTPGLRRIAEDLQGAYELRYTPGAAKADGSIRRIQLKLAREGVQLQAGRDVLVGASATPPAPEFEKPLLAALQAETLPRGVPAWDRALHFAWDGKEVEHVLGVSVPLRGVALQEDKGAGQFRGEVAILARIKDASGRVVRSFSQEFPMVGPLDQLAGARSQTIRFVRRLGLAPGDYTLETAVRDAQADTLTARRTRIQARAPEGLAQSSVSLGDLKPAGSDAEDPFRIEKQRLVPNLGEPIQAGGSPMTLHCVVYPVRGSKEPATATFTLTSGSEVLMSQAAPLPAPGADGRIAYGSALRVDLIPPGTYQMKIAVAQGSSRAEESTSFTIVR
jgi:hypothetical protein